jgi:arabinogalactan endo-1,4-beta-galactosidase
MEMMKVFLLTCSTLLMLNMAGCREEPNGNDDDDTGTALTDFYFGADLSYVNQILDHGGVYKDQGEVRSPYRIFKDHGNNLVRLRLWHNPEWTKDVYDPKGTVEYNGLEDVAKAIALSKEQGMQVLLDFHYSDSWADPGKQEIPAAWQGIRDIAVLKDSVYQYTFKTISYLKARDLVPELVQVGNEINCGMFTTAAPVGFPTCNACNGQWQQLGDVLNSAIAGVKDATTTATVKPKILLHVADPKNLEWWFDNIRDNGKVTAFDIIGFSYYPLWHTTVAPQQLQATVAALKSRYQKPLMILEMGYPWSTANNDSYNNIFGSQTPISGYPFTKEGQLEMLKFVTQAVASGGGVGVVYWEPAWISSQARDQWGQGSSWENTTFFDFDGNTLPSIDYTKHTYQVK